VCATASFVVTCVIFFDYFYAKSPVELVPAPRFWFCPTTHTLFTAIIAVPETQKVKVMYGMGQGTAHIGQVSPMANKMLALFG